MGSGAIGIGESFPKWYSEIVRKEECQEKVGFVWGKGNERCGTEAWFRVERKLCVKAVRPARVRQYWA